MRKKKRTIRDIGRGLILHFLDKYLRFLSKYVGCHVVTLEGDSRALRSNNATFPHQNNVRSPSDSLGGSSRANRMKDWKGVSFLRELLKKFCDYH